LAYGCLGDNVNLGSRLEGLNKMYRTQIIIGENTEQLVHGAFLLRELDVVRVKGKKKPVRIYELVDHAGSAPPGPEGDLLHHYAAGRSKPTGSNTGSRLWANSADAWKFCRVTGLHRSWRNAAESTGKPRPPKHGTGFSSTPTKDSSQSLFVPHG
jgi:hypothetical protein